jgi:hypothetical protein
MRIVTTYIFAVFVSIGRAQSTSSMGARSNSLANASVSLSDVWSFYHNVAAVGLLENMEVSCSYENRFFLSELQNQGAVFAVPLHTGVGSCGFQYFGFEQFRALGIGMGYSLRLGEQIYAGLQMNYHRVQLTQEYGVNGSLTFSAGVYGKVTEKWRIGASASNLGRAIISEMSGERLNSALRMGGAFSMTDNALLLIEVQKNTVNPVQFKSGVEYAVRKAFCLRYGLSLNPLCISFGFAYNRDKISIDCGTSYDTLLSWSPHLGFGLKLQKGEK